MAGRATKGRRGFCASHGRSRSRTYQCWNRMKQNCRNPRAAGYPYLGERGLGFDPAWDDFSAFHAEMGDCPEGHTLRRHDQTKGYAKGNCAWVPITEARTSRSWRSTPTG